MTFDRMRVALKPSSDRRPASWMKNAAAAAMPNSRGVSRRARTIEAGNSRISETLSRRNDHTTPFCAVLPRACVLVDRPPSHSDTAFRSSSGSGRAADTAARRSRNRGLRPCPLFELARAQAARPLTELRRIRGDARDRGRDPAGGVVHVQGALVERLAQQRPVRDDDRRPLVDGLVGGPQHGVVARRQRHHGVGAGEQPAVGRDAEKPGQRDVRRHPRLELGRQVPGIAGHEEPDVAAPRAPPRGSRPSARRS